MFAKLKALWSVVSVFTGGLPGGPLPWLGGALVVAAGIWIGALKIEVAHLEASKAKVETAYAEYQTKVAQATAFANAKAVSDLIKANELSDLALMSIRLRYTQTTAALTVRLQEIANADQTQDGAVAPVLAGSAGRLWK